MGEGSDGDDFDDAKVGAYAGVILFGGSGVVFFVMLVIAISVTIFGSVTGTARLVGVTLIPVLVVCTVAFGLLARWSLRLLRKWKRLDTRPIRAWATVGGSQRTSTK